MYIVVQKMHSETLLYVTLLPFRCIHISHITYICVIIHIKGTFWNLNWGRFGLCYLLIDIQIFSRLLSSSPALPQRSQPQHFSKKLAFKQSDFMAQMNSTVLHDIKHSKIYQIDGTGHIFFTPYIAYPQSGSRTIHAQLCKPCQTGNVIFNTFL